MLQRLVMQVVFQCIELAGLDLGISGLRLVQPVEIAADRSVGDPVAGAPDHERLQLPPGLVELMQPLVVQRHHVPAAVLDLLDHPQRLQLQQDAIRRGTAHIQRLGQLQLVELETPLHRAEHDIVLDLFRQGAPGVGAPDRSPPARRAKIGGSQRAPHDRMRIATHQESAPLEAADGPLLMQPPQSLAYRRATHVEDFGNVAFEQHQPRLQVPARHAAQQRIV